MADSDNVMLQMGHGPAMQSRSTCCALSGEAEVAPSTIVVRKFTDDAGQDEVVSSSGGLVKETEGAAAYAPAHSTATKAPGNYLPRSCI